MAGTFSQIYVQIVFSTKYRQPSIQSEWKHALFEYMSGIVRAKGQKSININGVEDHVHVFVGLKPGMCISDLVRDVKNNSSKWVNDMGHVPGGFAWQGGYSVFSYHQSMVRTVYEYIENQEEHHKKQTFKEELTDLLEEFKVAYNPAWVFDEPKN